MGQDFLKLSKLKQGSRSDGMGSSNEIYPIPKNPKESHLIFIKQISKIFKGPKFLIRKPQKIFEPGLINFFRKIEKIQNFYLISF